MISARSLARRLPQPARERIRAGLKRYRSARYRLRERVNPTHLDVADVAAALRECGIERGDDVFMQSKMSAFGSFMRGPETVLAALDEALGPEGLVAMPVYPVAAPAIEHLTADPLFDVRETPSQLGAISEAFRRRAGTPRSLHPTHCVSARGPGAEELVAGHELANTPFDPETPFGRMIARDALQVFFGPGTAPMTMYHPFECSHEPPFPLDVFYERRVDARCRDADGNDVVVRTLVHNPELGPGRIDANPVIQAHFREAILGRGGRTVGLGRGEILAIRLSSLFQAFEDLLQRGITMYDHPLPDRWPDERPQHRVRD